MPITYRIEMMYECDECQRQDAYDQCDVKRPTKKAFHVAAKKNGWFKNGNSCLCVDCKTKGAA